MNSYLLNRSFGSISPWDFHVAQTTRLVHCLEPASAIRFNSRHDSTDDSQREGELERIWAHKAGVNVLAIDQYEGRYMFSAGADPSIHFWDLESRTSGLSHLHQSTASVNRQSHPEAHTHAITSLSIYPFDPTPSTIITTSHDTTLKLSSIGESSITPVHTFSLESTPYSHSFSAHPASTLLIAVGTSQKSVRLLDLRSGLSTHSLPGHDAAIPSVAWAPHNEHILASASADNRVIIFDIRRGGRSSAIATLDMDDAVGVLSPESSSSTQPPRKAFTRDVRAHNGIVTGVRWTSDGGHLITSGQDARIRVWDASTGANTLVHFGPRIRNSASSNLAERAPLILPNSLFTPGHETLLWPNYNDVDDRGEIYMFELREGTFIKQLKLPGISSVARQRQRAQQQNQPTALSAARINALAWRGNGSSGEGMEMFSAHGDGTIKAWVSQIPEEEEADDKEKEKEERKRKRDVLEEVYQGLMQPTVTFT